MDHPSVHARQFVIPDFVIPNRPVAEPQNWDELIDLCLFNNVRVPGVSLLSEDESNVKNETASWKFLYNCQKRVMIESRYAMELSRKPVTEVKLIDSLEELLRYNIAVNLRKRRRQNTHFVVTNKKETNNVYSKATLVPAVYVSRTKTIETAYFLVVKENENEIRMKIRNNELYPGLIIDAHCPEGQHFRSTVKCCYASGEVQLPDGDYDIEDLLYTELDMKWTNGWHKNCNCSVESDMEFVQQQINQFETGNDWKRDRIGCLQRRHA